MHAVPGVARDHVAGRGRRAADRVAGGASLDHHAVIAVGQGRGAVVVRADQVALDHVVRGPGEGDVDAVVGVARDEVADDGVARRAAGDVQAVVAVGPRVHSAGIGADIVALDDVARGPLPGEEHAPAGVLGDDVAGQNGRPADRVARRASLDQHTVAAVARRGVALEGRAEEPASDRASHGQADDVARDDVARAGDEHAVAAEGVDRQPLDRDVRGVDRQAVGRRAGARTAEGDQRDAAIELLAGAVDRHRAGDRGQGRLQADRVQVGAGDVEVDRARAARVVGLGDGPSEAAIAAVGRVADGEGREHLAALERLDGETAAAVDAADAGAIVATAA